VLFDDRFIVISLLPGVLPPANFFLPEILVFFAGRPHHLFSLVEPKDERPFPALIGLFQLISRSFFPERLRKNHLLELYSYISPPSLGSLSPVVGRIFFSPQ